MASRNCIYSIQRNYKLWGALCDTVIALLSPQGAYLILETSKGGFLERGALFTKLHDKDT